MYKLFTDQLSVDFWLILQYLNQYKAVEQPKKHFLKLLFSPDILMITLLMTVCIYYGYQNILPLEPQSWHRWRQSDCATIGWNYYAGNPNFFEPEMNNRLVSGDGKVALEFPILYYLSGMTARAIGYGPWINRFLNIFIVLIGLWSVYKALRLLSFQAFWAIIIPLFVFASPLLAFFTNNFIPDTPALGLCLVGWYYFTKFHKEEKESFFIWALIFFTLSGLLKITYAISFVALGIIYMWEWILASRKRNTHKIRIFPIQAHARFLLYFVGVVGVVAVWISWYMYASWYSTHFERAHFSGIIHPIYKTPSAQIGWILDEIIDKRLVFFNHISLHITGWLLLAMCIFTRIGGHTRTLSFLLGLILLGVFIYFMMFFHLLGGHPYYHLPMLIPFLGAYVYGGYLIQMRFPQLNRSRVFQLIIVSFLAFNLYHAKTEVQKRYYRNALHGRELDAFYEQSFRDFLDRVGVTEDKLVISIPDISPNNTLYLMRRKGWSTQNVPEHNAERIAYLTELGAQYLIVSDTSLLTSDALKAVLHTEVGNYQHIRVYKLSD